MLTSRQIALVQSSFVHVLPLTDIAAAAFYRELFRRAPETQALFKGDLAEQGRKLFLTLSFVVDALDRPGKIVPVAQELALRHVRYGAEPRHYAVVGTALIETLRAGLGDGFDAATEEAWRAAYAMLSGAMLAALDKAAA